MHNSSIEDNYQFDPSIFEHVGPYFHTKHYVKDVPSMHYENQKNYFVLPTELIENFYVFGETDGKVFSSLPLGDISENQMFDRGKKNC